MTYIENIFICMVSPLLVAALCMGRRQLRFFLFCIAGMGVCLLSAYINTFLAAVCQADALAATAEIAPVVEEMMKLLPLMFYLLVFEPEGDKIKAAAITVALTFATFENVCLSHPERRGPLLLHLLPGLRHGRDARPLRLDRGRRACLHVAADVAEGCRHLWAAGRNHHPPCHLQSAHRLRPAGAAGGGRKAIRFPIITEVITEYPLFESCFLAALKFL